MAKHSDYPALGPGWWSAAKSPLLGIPDSRWGESERGHWQARTRNTRPLIPIRKGHPFLVEASWGGDCEYGCESIC